MAITFKDSPVEQLRKELPRGNGEWPGFESVYSRISKAANAMGLSNICGNQFHVETMAIMGSGDESTMKAHLHLLYIYGWL
jgi:hypothetical protein